MSISEYDIMSRLKGLEVLIGLKKCDGKERDRDAQTDCESGGCCPRHQENTISA